MIAKHVPMRLHNKSSFGRLVEYLNDPQNKQERIGKVTVTNCLTDNPHDAALEITATQALNTRTQIDKTYHLIISFRPGENPGPEVLVAIENRLCAALGYTAHQRISVVHHDTDNLHIHVAINKIHPVTYNTHTPYYDYKTLANTCEILEQEYNLELDNHVPRKTRSENRVDDMEAHAGIESLLSWIKRECAPQMIKAQSWAELHEIMHNNGLELRERGNGLVITNGKESLKASSVARELSKGQLEKRLGTFENSIVKSPTAASVASWRTQAPLVAKIGSQPPPHCKNAQHNLSAMPAMKLDNRQHYDRRPIFKNEVNTTELYAQYKMEQQNYGASRKNAMAQSRLQKKNLIEAAKQSNRFKRLAIKLLKGPGVNKKLLHNLASQSLRQNIATINTNYLKEHNTAYIKHAQQTWADWLKAKAIGGNSLALAALRARATQQSQCGDVVGGRNAIRLNTTPGLKLDNITKSGTIIYRVGSTAIRDDGGLLNVSQGAAVPGLQAALRMAIYRYGNHISVNGSTAFKERIAEVAATLKLDITFDDSALEQQRQGLLALATLNLPHSIVKEKDHEHQNPVGQFIHERGRGYCGSTSTAATIVCNRRVARKHRSLRASAADKSNLACFGYQPPSTRQNSLRNLSQLGMVQLTHRSKMLLPHHVPGDLEQQGAQRDNGLRREVHRAAIGVTSSTIVAKGSVKTKKSIR